MQDSMLASETVLRMRMGYHVDAARHAPPSQAPLDATAFFERPHGCIVVQRASSDLRLNPLEVLRPSPRESAKLRFGLCYRPARGTQGFVPRRDDRVAVARSVMAMPGDPKATQDIAARGQSEVARSLAAKTLEQIPALLAMTPRDPRALRYWQLPPLERVRAVQNAQR